MIDGPKIQAKSCHNCKHLEYIDASSEMWPDDRGLTCNKRNYKTQHDESRHLDQLNDPGYLAKGKSCFESKKKGKGA